MELLSEINVSNFFKNPENYIHIHFSNDFLAPNCEMLHGYWFFTQNNKTLGVSSETNIYLNEAKELFKIEELNNIIQKAQRRFKKDYPNITFPDIMIVSSDKGDAYIKSKSNAHRIEITFSSTNSLQCFEFALLHELGHIVFDQQKNEIKNSLKSVKYSLSYNIPSLAFATFCIGNGFMLLTTAIEQSLSLTICLSMVLLGLFCLIEPIMNAITFKKRTLNFSMEMFCDFYALKMANFNWADIPPDCLGKISFNHYSHPSVNNRIFNLKINQENTLKTWENPVIYYPELFTKFTYGDWFVFWKSRR